MVSAGMAAAMVAFAGPAAADITSTAAAPLSGLIRAIGTIVFNLYGLATSGLVAGTAGYIVDNDTIDRLAGVVMLNGVGLDGSMAASLDKVPDGIPIYQLAAPKYCWNPLRCWYGRLARGAARSVHRRHAGRRLTHRFDA